MLNFFNFLIFPIEQYNFIEAIDYYCKLVMIIFLNTLDVNIFEKRLLLLIEFDFVLLFTSLLVEFEFNKEEAGFSAESKINKVHFTSVSHQNIVYRQVLELFYNYFLRHQNFVVLMTVTHDQSSFFTAKQDFFTLIKMKSTLDLDVKLEFRQLFYCVRIN